MGQHEAINTPEAIQSLVVVQITHKIRPECVEHYMKMTLANAHATRQEPGNLRFDLLQDANDACTFQLYEVYLDRQAQQAHLATAHFATWKEAVQDVFADRSIKRFSAVHIS